MSAESSTSEFITVQVRLTRAEHEILKSNAKPNVSAWLRAKIRELPGGASLPPLPAPRPVEKDVPPWTPRAVVLGGKPGDPVLQVAAFVAALNAMMMGTISWRQWRPVHELYEGLRVVLTGGQGLRSVWREANLWKVKEGEHPDRELFEALFKFAAIRKEVRSWYESEYRISNAKRLRAKEKNPEQFLKKQRERMAAYRARKKSAAAAEIKERSQQQVAFDEFASEHVSDHWGSSDYAPIAAE